MAKSCWISLGLLVGIATVSASESAEVDRSGRSVEENPADYRIGIDDVLKVVVRGEPELSLSLTVRPDGRITVPLVDEVDVAGLTPREVKDRITERLSGLVRDPDVTVIVDEINSFRVYFLGEIGTQGVIHFSKPPRLLQAIAAAGGLTEFSKREIILLRQHGGVEKRFVIRYKRLVSGDPRQENLRLMPDDTLIFP